jgi:hypothetical protein
MMTNERVTFRLIQMPCCGQLVCWINPRLANYCPECGKYVFDKIKSCVLVSDDTAMIRTNSKPVMERINGV